LQNIVSFIGLFYNRARKQARAKNLAELEVVRFRGHGFLEGTLSPPKLGVGVEVVGV